MSPEVGEFSSEERKIRLEIRLGGLECGDCGAEVGVFLLELADAFLQVTKTVARVDAEGLGGLDRLLGCFKGVS